VKKASEKVILDDPEQLFFSFAGGAGVSGEAAESAAAIPLSAVVPPPLAPSIPEFRAELKPASVARVDQTVTPAVAAAQAPGGPAQRAGSRSDKKPQLDRSVSNLAASVEEMLSGGDAAELAALAASVPQQSASKEFITESRVAEIVLKIGALRRPGQIKKVRIAFYPFRATLYSFKISKQGVAKVKFHVAFRQASAEVFTQAADLMLTRRRAERKVLQRAAYDAFVRSIPHSDFELPGARKARKVALSGPGRFRSLDESFTRVNDEYFHGRLEKPELCWSPVRARRILGSYQERNDRLIISQLFDNPKVPLFVLDYLMYHELLHKFLGIGRRSNGTRCMHGKEFREIEKQFRYFDEAQQFLKVL